MKTISTNDSLSVIDAIDNYWGVTDSVSIEQLIFHHADTSTVPKVDFIPFAFDMFDISAGSPTAVGDEENIVAPARYELEQNYPNPFNPTTTIEFTLPHRANVEITVYNVLGQQVYNLVSQSLPAGTHSVEWDGRDKSGNTVSTGIYLYRLRADDFVETRKMVLVK